MLTLLGAATAATTLEICDPAAPTEGCFDTIQEAVDAAADGDEIVLPMLTFEESISLEDRALTFTGTPGGSVWRSEDSPALAVLNSQLTVSGVVFDAEGDAPSITQFEGELTLSDCQFDAGDGGAVIVEDVSFHATNSAFIGGRIYRSAAHLLALESEVNLDYCTFTDGYSSYASAVYVVGGTLDAEGCVFSGNRSDVAAGALLASVEEAELRGCVFEGNSGQDGAVYVAAHNGTATLTDGRFVENVSTAGASAAFLSASEVSVLRNLICANTADPDHPLGAALAVDTLDGVIANNALVENTHGALKVDGGIDVAVRNNHFVNNRSPNGAPLILSQSTRASAVDVRYNLFTGNLANIGGLPVYMLEGGEDQLNSNVWFDNEPEADASLDPTGVFRDPELDDYVADGKCRFPQTIQDTDELWSDWDSPLRDLGPAVATSAEELDLDGSPVDAGAFGGPDARAFPDWSDLDEDGVPNLYDCDLNDGATYPGAPDAPYDGVDNDCDEGDDFDADRDGQGAKEYGGLDCDDVDATVFLGAVETPYDGIDQNCDGADLKDVDGDGFAAGEDCDDTDDRVYPGAVDQDLGTDWDCDGYADPALGLKPRGCATPGANLLALALGGLLAARGRRGAR